jgi:hypothetical protein
VYRIDVPTTGQRLIAQVTALDGGLLPSLELQADACGPTGFSIGCFSSGSAAEPTARLISRGVDAGTYYLAVDGLLATSGDYRLELTLEAPFTDTFGSTCAAEPQLALVDGGLDLESDTRGAFDDGVLSCTSTGSPDRNYLLMTPGAGPTQVTVGAWYETDEASTMVLAVLDRCAADAGVLACESRGSQGLPLGTASRFTATLDGGTPLHLWLDTFNPFGGDPTQAFHLRVRTSPLLPLTSGACSAMAPALSSATTYAGSTLGLRSHFDSYASTVCQVDQHHGGDFTWRYVPAATGIATIRVEPERGVDL